jgi:anaerobic magnesium-protoporphyrin IX monomethyl ester cyclase
VEVQILFLEDTPDSEVAQLILESTPELVGFTCYSWNLQASGRVSRLLRTEDSALPIVWGGCSFLQLQQEHSWFEWWDTIDAVAVGPGELTLELLVSTLMAGGSPFSPPLPGLMVNEKGSLLNGPPAQSPKHLDDLASPYTLGIAKPVPRPYIEMARGCLYQCTFCSDARAVRGNLLERSVQKIADDIHSISQWPELEWVDAGASTANVTTEAIVGACTAILQGDPQQRAVYSFQLYPSLVCQEQRDAMNGVRIGKLCIGLQSTTDATFRPMKRSGKLAHLQRALNILDGVGPLYVSVLLGLPGETLQSFKDMMDELLRMKGVTISVHRLLILPGTTMHTHAAKMGLSFDPQRFYRATRSSHMTEDDFTEAQEYVVTRAIDARQKQQYGVARIDWTNFDDQHRAFDPPLVDGQMFHHR